MYTHTDTRFVRREHRRKKTPAEILAYTERVRAIRAIRERNIVQQQATVNIDTVIEIKSSDENKQQYICYECKHPEKYGNGGCKVDICSNCK